MKLNDATGYSHEPALSPGETLIIQKLEELQETLDEVIEKLSNLNLSDNEGFSIDS